MSLFDGEDLTAARIRGHQAQQALWAAELLADHGVARSSVKRSDYAASHAASALLASHGIFPRRHDEVIAMLSPHFVKPGALGKEAAPDLQRLQDQRLIADDKGYLDREAGDGAE